MHDCYVRAYIIGWMGGFQVGLPSRGGINTRLLICICTRTHIRICVYACSQVLPLFFMSIKKKNVKLLHILHTMRILPKGSIATTHLITLWWKVFKKKETHNPWQLTYGAKSHTPPFCHGLDKGILFKLPTRLYSWEVRNRSERNRIFHRGKKQLKT